MALRVKRLLLFITILFCSFTGVYAQTLYWVGGSGNFNDPNHWALSSGGKNSNNIPNSSTDVVFDDKSGTDYVIIDLPPFASVRSFNAVNTKCKIIFSNTSAATLNISSSIQLSTAASFDFTGDLIFRAKDNNRNIVNFNLNKLKCNVFFYEGDYNILPLRLQNNSKVSFKDGSYRFRYSSLTASDVSVKGNQTKFLLDTSYFNISNSFIIDDSPNFNANKFGFYAPFSNTNNVKLGSVTFNSNSKLVDNKLNAVCQGTITTFPECSGSCTGSFTLQIDATCTSTYNLAVGGTTCTATENNIATNNLLPGTTYTVGNLCACGTSYAATVFDVLTFIPIPLNTSNFNFTPPSFLLNTLASVKPSCFTSCNGSMTLSIAGGTAPYTITVNPPIAPPIASAAGGFTIGNMCGNVNYTFTIVDKNGCSASPTKSLSPPPALIANGTTQSITCFGACTGSTQVTPTGGTPGYTVNWSTGSSVAIGAGGTSSLTSLCASVSPVTATVTDTKGCVTTYSSPVLQPTAALTAVQSQTNATCGGTCNASAQVTPSGGTPGYSYTWAPSGSFTGQGTPLYSSLCGSNVPVSPNYTVTIADANLCVITKTFAISQPQPLVVAPTFTNASCNTLCDGAANSNASGGNPVYSYTWATPVPSTVTTQNISGLCAGVYTLTVKDASSCVTSSLVTITQPPAITLTVNQTSITCNGQCTGSATATAVGGNGGFTYTWTAPTPSVITGQSTATVSALCAGLYTLTVKDASNCPVPIATFSISQPLPISPNVTSTTITCNGSCNGIITSAPTGGTGPYNYTLTSTTFTGTVTNSATATFNNLCASATAGIYTLSIGDATSGCIRTQTINLLQPNQLNLTATTTSVTCGGGCNASLAGNAVGGTPAYSYTWTTPAPATFFTPAISGQCVGTYTLDVKDANGCTSQTIVSVVAPTTLTVLLTPTSPSCFGGCNGSITSTVSGGTPTYTYNWSTGASGSGGPTSIGGLCAGSYSLTITDANGCKQTTATTVVATPSIVVSTTAIPTNCAGSCDGQAIVSASGGTPPYVYSWNTIPVTTNTTGIVNGLCSGNYVVTVTDSKGCIQNANITITSPPLLSVAVNSVIPSCNICIGAATITPSGGNPGYSYTWTPAPGGGQGTSTPTGLCVGVYTVLVVDTKGCSSTKTINVSQSVIVNVTTTGTLLTCNPGCTGIANANVSGGNPPYTYTWTTTVPTQTTATATNLCAGTYTVNVMDVSGCTNTSTITFNNPPAINVTSTITNASCNGNCNGAISITATGGTGAISYTWSPVGGNSPTASGLCAGTYTLDVRDANNCTVTRTFVVTEPTALTATFTPVSPSTCGGTNGSITANVGGGSSSYSYTWTPSAQTGSVAVNLGAGSYTLTVKDGAGCTQALVATLSDPTGPTVTVTSSSVTCNGLCNGSATVNVTGTAPININWAAPIVSTNSVVSGLCQGTFAVNVSDATNCLVSQTISITQPPTFSLNPVVTNPKCGTACDGTITTSPSGATAPYSFTWTPGSVNSPTLSNICGGSYTANISDGNNCAFTQTFTVTQPSSITVAFATSNVLCNGSCNGTIKVTPSGGTAPYTYSWTPVGSFPGSILNNLINLCANVYTLTVTDANNCSTTVTVQITEPPALTGTLAVQDALCNSQCNGSATITAGGGTPNYGYSWTGSSATTSVVTGLCAGNYVNTITDANGCTLTQSFVINSPAGISVTLTPTNPSCNGLCNGSITTVATGGTGVLTYSWIATGTGQNPTGLCAGNYTAIVTDVNGCTGQNVTVLTNPPALLANASFTNPSCPGACNGTAISNPANGTAPFSFTWSPVGGNSPIATGLCSGTYSVIVVDNKLCVDTQQIVLTGPTTLTINPSASPASCGVCNGSLNVIPSGGTPSYSLTWTPAVGVGTVAINLCAGIYTLGVTDANGCSSNFSIPLSNSNGPSGATVSFTNVACNGQCNGAASVTNPIGGTPGYTITWVSPSSSSNPITGLCAGTYTAQIQDANNCLFFQSVPINEPAVLSPSTTVTQPLCSGNCNGTITSSPTGGNPAYTYSWSTGATTSSITNICPGNYTVTVTDSKSCVATQTFNLPGTVNITASSVAINNNCFGNCNGSLLAASVAGGLPPYTYNWSDPLGQSTAQAFNLCNGNYFLVITDAQGCFDTIRGTIISPSAITLTSSVVQPSCGICNGSSTVSAMGGTGPYTYTWSSGSATANEANLCAGIYMVTITDANGCLQNVNVPINNSSTLTETVTSTNETCFAQCNGAATVTAGGGTAPITYNWLSPSSTSPSLNGLCAGTYFVQMTDAVGCIRNASVNISSASDLTITPFVTQPGCSVNNGSISVAVAGGNPGYTYLWSPGGAVTSSITGLGVGTYSVTITDLSGCSKTMVFPLTNVNAPVFNFSSTNALCSGTCNAVANISVTSGVAPYTFSWSAGTISSGASTSTATGLCSGVITATVTSITNGCSSVQSLTVTQPPPLLMSLPNLTTPKCNNNCNGSITLIPSGGVLPYTYTWIPSASTNPITNLCAGTYSGTVTDANGCTVSNSYTLINPAVLTLTANVLNSTCNTATDGAITTTVAGGLPAYTYTWTGPGTFTSTSSSLTNVLSGTYSLTLIDFAGCRKDTTLMIVPTISVQAIAGRDSSFCQSGTFVLNGSLSSGGTTYNWFLLPSATSFTNTLITTVSPPVGTSTYVLVATNGACVSRDTVQITSNTPPIVDAGPNYTITIFTSTVIGGSPTGPAGSTYTWMPSNTLDNGTLSNPVASNTVNTTYTVLVTDVNGCVGSDTMYVHIFPEIFIPNGFSNNGDGKNDYWVIDNIQQFPDCVVEVYNRWGELLFISTGYSTPWDGKYKGKDVPVGTYYYIIDLHHVNFPKAYTGPLTIFR